MTLAGEVSKRSNSQVIFVLIHAVRVAILLEFAALMWYNFLTWSPIPSPPGGPPAAQINLIYPTLLMTAALIIRIILTRSIWFRGGRNLAYAASADAFEIGVIISIWGFRLVFSGFGLDTLLISIVLILPSCSLILSLFFIYREMTMKTTPDTLV